MSPPMYEWTNSRNALRRPWIWTIASLIVALPLGSQILADDSSAAATHGQTDSSVEKTSSNQPLGLNDTPSPASPSTVIPRRSASADRTQEAATADEADRPTVAWYRSPWISLLLVLAAIGLLAVLLRRVTRGQPGTAASTLRVIGRVPLGTRQSVALVRLGERLLVLGVTDQHVSPVSEITDAEEIARIVSQGSTPLSRDSFARSLNQEKIRILGLPPAAAGPTAAPENAVQRLIRALNDRRSALQRNSAGGN